MAEYIEREAVLEQLNLLARHEDEFRQSVILGVAHFLLFKCGVAIAEECVSWFNYCPNCGAKMGGAD